MSQTGSRNDEPSLLCVCVTSISIYVDSHVVRLDIRVCVEYHIWLAQICVCVTHMSILYVDLDMVHLDMRPRNSVDMCPTLYIHVYVYVYVCI